MASNFIFWDRFRAFTRQYNIYPHERILQNQPSIDRIFGGGGVLENDLQSAILDQTNLQINRIERYRDVEQMDQMGEVSLALDLYADETSLVDPERKHTLIIRARNRRLKKELEELFFNILQWDTHCRPASRYLCKYGDMPFEIVPKPNRDGVACIRPIDVYNFTRVETKYGDLVGFFYMDVNKPEPAFMYPWQVAHMRLTSYENIHHPYGRSVLEGGRKAFKQLRLMEDAALIYRITRAPEKRKFSIPVGSIAPHEVPEYMLQIARQFKRQRFYNPTTGTFDERYSPLIQEDDFFLHRRSDGTGPDIEVLPGGENVDKIQDIEYFKKKMIAPTKIPFARVGIGEGSGEASEKSLSQAHNEFAKAVQWVQREIAMSLHKVAIVHLALRGFRVEDLKGFEISLSATSAMEELYRIETWQTRAGVMAELKDLGWFPKEWIVTHFTDLSPDEIEELKEMESTEANGGAGGGGPLNLDAPEDAAGGESMPTDEESLGGEDDPLSDADAAAAGMPPDDDAEEVPEGIDFRYEKRIINESKATKRDLRRMELLRKWRSRLGFDGGLEERPLNSGYWSMLESKEFDALSMSADPDDDGALLVEWSTKPEDRKAVIAETLDVLTCGERRVSGEDANVITEEDLPITVSNI